MTSNKDENKNLQFKISKVYKFEEIEIGKVFEFEHFLYEEDINKFANLIGDFNPRHVNEEFAKNSFYNGKISHGMLSASLFSTLLGMYCPGRDNIILSLYIKFKKPVRPQANLIVRGEVLNKVNALKMLTIKTSIINDSNILIEGEAKVSMV